MGTVCVLRISTLNLHYLHHLHYLHVTQNGLTAPFPSENESFLILSNSIHTLVHNCPQTSIIDPCNLPTFVKWESHQIGFPWYHHPRHWIHLHITYTDTAASYDYNAFKINWIGLSFWKFLHDFLLISCGCIPILPLLSITLRSHSTLNNCKIVLMDFLSHNVPPWSIS